MSYDNIRHIAKKIEQAESIVLTTHTSHDGDAAGSMLALYHVLVSYGKNVRMILNEPLSKRYLFLPGSGKITQCSGKLDCDLLMILDSDGMEPARLGTRGAEINPRYVCCIDHHVTNKREATARILDSVAGSTGEVLFDIFSICGIKINKDVAGCLYTAIVTDTGNFRYTNTSARNMSIAAALIRSGAEPAAINDFLSMHEFESNFVLRDVLGTMKQAGDGIVTIALSNELYLRAGDDSDRFIDFARYSEGCLAAILFKEINKGEHKVSLRMKHADAARFAEQYGGGGHTRAAGFTCSGEQKQVMQMVVGKAREYLQEYEKNRKG